VPQRRVETLFVGRAPTKRGGSNGRDTVVVIAVFGMIAALALILIVGAVSDVGKLPSRDFYGFAAGILPVLLLAFAWEERAQKAFRRMGLRQMIIGTLGVGEVLAVLAVSGTLEPARTAYQDYAEDTLDESHTLAHVIDEGALVAPSFGWSLVLATLVSFSLAVSLIGVLSIAFARSDDSADDAAASALPDGPAERSR
jgi:hypothetical protein